MLELAGHFVEILFGAEFGVHAQGIRNIVTVRTSAARLVSRRGIQVRDTQVAEIRNQVAPVYEAKTLVELHAIGGSRGLTHEASSKSVIRWAGMRILSGACVIS